MKKQNGNEDDDEGAKKQNEDRPMRDRPFLYEMHWNIG